MFWDLVDENGAKFVEQFRGKSKDEAERLVSPLRKVAPSVVRDRIKPVTVGTACRRQAALGFGEEAKAEETSNYHRDAEAGTAAGNTSELFLISFSASPEFITLLRRAQELMFRGRKEDVQLENVMAKALKAYLHKQCPKDRHERRLKRKAKRSGKTLKARGSAKAGREMRALMANGKGYLFPWEEKQPVRATERTNKEKERRIPLWLRDEVLARDQYRCTYVGYGGVACGCPGDLEVDHVLPVARGGGNSAENLRVLCRQHNFAAASEIFGEEYLQWKIAKKKPSGKVGTTA